MTINLGYTGSSFTIKTPFPCSEFRNPDTKNRTSYDSMYINVQSRQLRGAGKWTSGCLGLRGQESASRGQQGHTHSGGFVLCLF